MADERNNSEGKTLAQQHVAFDQLPSQNVNVKPWLKELAVFGAFTAAGGLMGGVVGKWQQVGKKLSNLFKTKDPLAKAILENPRMDKWIGVKLGSIAGGTYGVYHHWQNKKAQELAINNNSTGFTEAFDPAQLEKTLKKEQEIVDGLVELHRTDHAASVISQREANKALEVGGR